MALSRGCARSTKRLTAIEPALQSYPLSMSLCLAGQSVGAVHVLFAYSVLPCFFVGCDVIPDLPCRRALMLLPRFIQRASVPQAVLLLRPQGISYYD